MHNVGMSKPKPTGNYKRMPIRSEATSSTANTAAMMEGSKAMGLARNRQRLAEAKVKSKKKNAPKPIGPIIL